MTTFTYEVEALTYHYTDEKNRSKYTIELDVKDIDGAQKLLSKIYPKLERVKLKLLSQKPYVSPIPNLPVHESSMKTQYKDNWARNRKNLYCNKSNCECDKRHPGERTTRKKSIHNNKELKHNTVLLNYYPWD